MGENITMYMNKQPGLQHVNKSWENSTQGKNCSAQELINFFDVYCSTGSIKLHIYLCQLYKVDMDVPHEISLAQEKCSTGPKNLAFFWYWSYCYVTRKLDETCWICRHWITKIRQKLDKHIGNFLSRIKRIQTATLLYRFANGQNIF